MNSILNSRYQSHLVLAASLALSASIALPARAQTASVVETLPMPASVPETVLPLSPQSGEIQLRGRVLSANTAARRLTINVTDFSLPSGRSARLSAPRRKIVFLAEKAELRAASSRADSSQHLAWSQVAPGRTIIVVGADTGTGNPLSARSVEIGPSLARPSTKPQPKQQLNPQGTYPNTKSFNGVKQWVADSGWRVRAKFKVSEVGGRASRGNPNSQHPRGLALDFMVGRDAAKGNAIATYFQKHAAAENVLYIIWKDRLVYGGSAPLDWSKIPVDYSHDVTERHMDHVHVSYNSTPRK
jgi:hypothetical protein